jgi:hypothetical protein
MHLAAAGADHQRNFTRYCRWTDQQSQDGDVAAIKETSDRLDDKPAQAWE